jgi:predicted nucleotidyltransferase
MRLTWLVKPSSACEATTLRWKTVANGFAMFANLSGGSGKTMATALDLTSEELHIYQVAARRRQKQEQRKLAHREKRAWELAHRAAALLREQFGATRIVVFGSLVHEGAFTLWSDLDIAAWGIRPEDTFLAIGAVMDLDPEVQVNLVDVATCSPSLLTIIKREGMQL